LCKLQYSCIWRLLSVRQWMYFQILVVDSIQIIHTEISELTQVRTAALGLIPYVMFKMNQH
jgi:predicted ATP-dependent serine protease